MSTHLLYPFICQWAFMLLPRPGYCKQCHNEHWGACVLLSYCFIWIYTQYWDCWVIWYFYFHFLRNFHTVLHSGCINLHSHQQCKRALVSPHPLQHLLVVDFFLISHQFYTHQCIHVNPNRPIQHTTVPTPLWFSPLGVHTFVLYICLNFCPANWFICTIWL